MAELKIQVRLGGHPGSLAIQWNERELLTGLRWSFEKASSRAAIPIPYIVSELVDRMRGYFVEGKPLGTIPWDHLDQSQWTDFQRRVFSAIGRIPHGETRTYGWVAERVGSVLATRAVGQALRHNPLPILVPCHRVVSATSLGGFMGVSDPGQPELMLKQKLLALEDVYRSPLFDFMAATA